MNLTAHAVAFVVLGAAFSFPALAQDPTPATPTTPTKTAPTRTPAVRVGGAPTKSATEAPVYDEQANARDVVALAVAKAKKENQRVLIQWGANWCGWCKWLAGTMQSDPGLSKELLYEYVVVHVDVGQFNKNMDLAKDLGAEFKAIPYLTILDGDGKAVVHQNTEPFEIQTDGKGGHDPKKVLEWLTKYATKPWDANTVLAEGLAKAGKEHKRLFLHFGAPWCGWCHRLEDWMARPEIGALLAKDFVDVKIDTDRMTNGKQVYEAKLEAARQKETGIPWFVFLDADGKLLAHSNGPKGNVGFPYQADEIEHFATMLKAAKQNLTDADIATLGVTLNENRTKDEARRTAK